MFAIRTALLSTLIPLGAAAIASWSCRDQHRSAGFIELLRLLDAEVPRTQAIHLILDPVRLHCSAEVAVYIACDRGASASTGCRSMPPGSPLLKPDSPS